MPSAELDAADGALQELRPALARLAPLVHELKQRAAADAVARDAADARDARSTDDAAGVRAELAQAHADLVAEARALPGQSARAGRIIASAPRRRVTKFLFRSARRPTYPPPSRRAGRRARTRARRTWRRGGAGARALARGENASSRRGVPVRRFFSLATRSPPPKLLSERGWLGRANHHRGACPLARGVPSVGAALARGGGTAAISREMTCRVRIWPLHHST